MGSEEGVVGEVFDEGETLGFGQRVEAEDEVEGGPEVGVGDSGEELARVG